MSLSLEWNNETSYELSNDLICKLQSLLQKAGESENVLSGEVALSFVDDAEIQQLNKDFRGIDRPTDVLSFAMQESGDEEPEIYYGDDEEDEDVSADPDEIDDLPELLGDIIISIPRAQAQSEEYGHSLDREIGFLFVHGFLHLIGYDHQDEAAEKLMFEKQEKILQEIGLTR